MRETALLETVRNAMNELASLKSTENMLLWDQWTKLPKCALPFRGIMFAEIARRRTELFHSPEVKAAYYSLIKTGGVDSDDLFEKGMVSRFLHVAKHTIPIPDALPTEFARVSSEAQSVWKQAYLESNYGLLKPLLERLFSLKKEMAKYISNGEADLFETVMDATDEGVSLTVLKREAEKVKNEMTALLFEISTSGKPIDDSFLSVRESEEAIYQFAQYMAISIGYDETKGGFGRIQHPFTAMIGPHDARISTWCSSFVFGTIAMIHETGHAMYAYSSADRAVECGIWNGIAGGFHEGQSRFFENMIGRGRPLWERNLSEAKRRFSSLEKVSTDAFYKAINRVDCNVLRTHADEVSYSLHPIIRMEIEEKLFHGDLRFDDVPAAWNEAYRRQLGLTVKNDREGVLQDAHWAMGFIGYFQSYLLGNLYSGMIREQIEKEMPDWERMIATEGCKELNEWMDCNVRQYGAAFTGPELIRRITGKPLCADPYIHYIKEKYTDIYEMRKEEKKC